VENKGVFFCKKVKNVFFVKKSGKWGGCFVKKVEKYRAAILAK